MACHPGRTWPLVVETVVGGVLLGGHAVASFALPLAAALALPSQHRLRAVRAAPAAANVPSRRAA